MKNSARWLLGAMLVIPAIMLGINFPGYVFWLIGYMIVMAIVLRGRSSNDVKGGSVIYLGAAIAVLGKHYIPIFTDLHIGEVEDKLIIETFFQVMLMASSGLGGSLIAHYYLSEKPKKK
ncbi:hypothetical protein [Vibrio anguillarum]|uniref:hypothetical protein n=1 Tax=Vibrio anguillarum TaxID=55601 RepID=UPI000BB50FA2|nr:hypothetical protein [Vibrio anguillarum]ATC59554.1 hypothetical protein CMV05_19105 [Vibrio anguillarum]MBF4217390.1 hypothetical protein [Vibrio anguillarum]MBF4250407.1 hypothetical protein [Vibrio anguillarum]MBF4389765.1 hypothetical protein [Vibrio anguillarum]MBF4404698.1 hypothetical protein [Vibrio anguillarum]